MFDELEDGVLAEWVVSSQGYVESASATYVKRGLDRVRVTEVLPKGQTAARDEAMFDILEKGMAGIEEGKGQELGKPHWHRKERGE